MALKNCFMGVYLETGFVEKKNEMLWQKQKKRHNEMLALG